MSHRRDILRDSKVHVFSDFFTMQATQTLIAFLIIGFLLVPVIACNALIVEACLNFFSESFEFIRESKTRFFKHELNMETIRFEKEKLHYFCHSIHFTRGSFAEQQFS